MIPVSYTAWRISFQSDQQALAAAWQKMCDQSAQLARAKAQLLAIASAPRSNFEDSVEYQDWAASKAAMAIVDMLAPAAKQITRSPGRCVVCGAGLDEVHHLQCAYARLATRQAG